MISVRGIDDLRRLPDLPGRSVSIALPGVTEAGNAAIEARLAPLVAACGCQEATVGLLLGLAAGSIGSTLIGLGWWSVAAAMLSGLASSAVMRSMALRCARRRLREAVRRELDGLETLAPSSRCPVPLPAHRA